MPEVDGVALLQHLAEQDSSAAIYLMTGLDLDAIRDAWNLGTELGLGMAGAFRKPVSVATMRSELAKHLEQGEGPVDPA